MAQVQGIPYRRHGPSAALREFLDPLDPGDFFDCGRARLHGLDDALLEEARSRGREVGDDDFLLVATDVGLFFCRPSISFVISARWEEISLIRPRGDDPVILPVTWPRHGELNFTVSKRLAGNVFRRWLQLRMRSARQARQGEYRRLPIDEPLVAVEAEIDLDADPDLDADLDQGRAERLAPDQDGDDLFGDGDTEVGDLDRTDFESSFVDEDVDAGLDVDTDWPAGATSDPEPIDLDLEPDLDNGGLVADGAGPTDWSLLDEIDTVDPSPLPAETSDDLPLFEPVATRVGAGSLADDQLQRVTVPRTTKPPPSWVGSAVSLAAVLVVISTVVLIATVSVSVWRGTSGATIAASADGADGPGPTIDHQRFRSPSETIAQAGDDGDEEAGGLAPSSAGGASQSIPSSSQQLLAAPGETPGPPAGPTLDPGAALRCNSNYSGCIPDVDDTAGADVDCVGQGDGPYFAETEVMVLGEDVYGLDSDGDRLACEADQLTADQLTADPPQTDG